MMVVRFGHLLTVVAVVWPVRWLISLMPTVALVPAAAGVYKTSLVTLAAVLMKAPS